MSPKKIFLFGCAVAALLALVIASAFPAQAAPTNDDILNATQIFSLLFEDVTDTSGATTAPDDPNPSCNIYGTREATVWYQYSPAYSHRAIAQILSANFPFVIGVFSGSPGALTEVGCGIDTNSVSFQADAGQTYYILVADVSFSPYPGPDPVVYGGFMDFTLAESADPIADFDYWNEPNFGAHAVFFNNWSYDPNCYWCSLEAYWDFGDGTTDTAWGPIHQFPADGTYPVTLIVTNQEGKSAQVEKLVEVVTPPPDASFSFYPPDPSTYDMVFFNYWSCGWCTAHWDFGDGAASTELNPNHRYEADGEYTVTLTATAPDGQSASTSQVVTVRTIDVAIARFTVPQSAKAGQTRSVTVEISNATYPVAVNVELYKSNGQGWDWVGSLQQTVPVRGGNRTTKFEFSYTFTQADALLGTLNFRAVASVWDGRDALPTNNEAISLPTRVNP